MARYRLEIDSDGNLGIYHRTDSSQPDLWIGDILEPESPNPVLALGIPVGLLGVRRISRCVREVEDLGPLQERTEAAVAALGKIPHTHSEMAEGTWR